MRAADLLRPPGNKAVLAAVVGNILEWYDFTSYGLFAVPIAHAFFPNSVPLKSILLATGTFGVGFVMRPIGAIVLGQYADRAGRKAALTLIIALMTAGTALIAFVPAYSEIGALAPLLIVFARLLQGFSVGGDLGSATAFIMESAPSRQRGRYAGWQASSQYGGSLLGALVAALVSYLLTESQVLQWGWRVPFIFGLAVGPIGFYIRSRTEEPAEFLVDAARSSGTPLQEVWRSYWPGVLRTCGITVLYTIATYTLLLYMPTYAALYLDIPISTSLFATAIAQIVLVCVCPIAGAWSDRIGRQKLIVWASGALMISAYPFFHLLVDHPTAKWLVTSQALMAVMLGVLAGPAVAYMGDLFPARVRSTGLSLGYNLAVPIFGGFGAFTVTWLIAATGDRAAPGIYLMFGSIVTLATLWCGSKRSAASAAFDNSR